LTGRADVVDLTSMKMKLNWLAALGAAALLTAGCIDTVSGGKTGGVPFVKDSLESRYDRPATEIAQAAREVIAGNGALVNEITIHGQTNAVGGVALAVEGRVNQSSVWVRVTQVDARVSDVVVQARTRAGGADVDTAALVDKQIALKLVR
jgi:hypothetical protein